MSCIIFDGKSCANEKEQALIALLSRRENPRPIRVKSFLFTEDDGSVLYTRLKQSAAERIGISYEPVKLSVEMLSDDIVALITAASKDATVTGVMVQKPAKETWARYNPDGDFRTWWNMLTSAIFPTKDVDCLTNENLQRILQGDSTDGYPVPATVRACLTILSQAKHMLGMSDEDWRSQSAIVIGRSDIVGKPLAALLSPQLAHVENVGRDIPSSLTAFDIVVAATGVPDLVTGSMLKEGALVIDVGAPKGDVHRESVQPKASFLTPVPGGVGPLTVVSLMENIVDLVM